METATVSVGQIILDLLHFKAVRKFPKESWNEKIWRWKKYHTVSVSVTLNLWRYRCYSNRWAAQK